MGDSSSRENILRNIRKALRTPVPSPFPDQDPGEAVYPKPSDDLSVLFAAAFTRLMGKFAYCESEQDLITQVGELIRQQGWKEVYCVEDRLRQVLPGFGFSQQALADSSVLPGLHSWSGIFPMHCSCYKTATVQTFLRW